MSTRTDRVDSAPPAAFRGSPLSSHSAFPSLAVALAVGLLTAAWLTSAQAADWVATAAAYATDAASHDSGVRTVSYSTSEQDHKLKWLPYRPSKADVSRGSSAPTAARGGERLAQYTSPVLPKPAAEGAVDPFDDPFGDLKAGAKPLLSGTTLQDEVLEGPRPEQVVPGRLPDVVIDDPSLQPNLLERAEEESVVVAPSVLEDPCSSVRLTPINQITHDISAAGDMFPEECPLIHSGPPDRLAHGWDPITFTWKATALCHKPAYFEQVALEQYGHSWGPYLQPVVSGAHFFLTVPVLPYKMGLYPPNECIYSLGYYRPGSCAPYMLDPLPLSIRAALFEAGAWTGAVFLIP